MYDSVSEELQTTTKQFAFRKTTSGVNLCDYIHKNLENIHQRNWNYYFIDLHNYYETDDEEALVAIALMSGTEGAGAAAKPHKCIFVAYKEDGSRYSWDFSKHMYDSVSEELQTTTKQFAFRKTTSGVNLCDYIHKNLENIHQRNWNYYFIDLHNYYETDDEEVGDNFFGDRERRERFAVFNHAICKLHTCPPDEFFGGYCTQAARTCFQFAGAESTACPIRSPEDLKAFAAFLYSHPKCALYRRESGIQRRLRLADPSPRKLGINGLPGLGEIEDEEAGGFSVEDRRGKYAKMNWEKGMWDETDDDALDDEEVGWDDFGKPSHVGFQKPTGESIMNSIMWDNTDDDEDDNVVTTPRGRIYKPPVCMFLSKEDCDLPVFNKVSYFSRFAAYNFICSWCVGRFIPASKITASLATLPQLCRTDQNCKGNLECFVNQDIVEDETSKAIFMRGANVSRWMGEGPCFDTAHALSPPGR
eukprot:g1236.t1